MEYKLIYFDRRFNKWAIWRSDYFHLNEAYHQLNKDKEGHGILFLLAVMESGTKLEDVPLFF